MTPEMPLIPENNKDEAEQPWFQRWIELVKSFLGATELEAIVKDLSTGSDSAGKVDRVLEIMSGKEDSQKRAFLDKLVGALLVEDSGEVENLLAAEIHEPEDLKIFDGLIQRAKIHESGDGIDLKKEEEAFVEARDKVKEKEEKSIDMVDAEFDKIGMAGIKEKIEEIQKQIEEQRLDRQTTPTKEWFEKELIARRIEVEYQSRNRMLNPLQESLKIKSLETTKNIVGRMFEGGGLPESLTAEQKAHLHLYFYDGNKRDITTKQKLLLKLIEAANENSETKKYLLEMAAPVNSHNTTMNKDTLNSLGSLIDDEVGKGAGKDVTDLLRMMAGGAEDGETTAGNSLRYLNIEPKLYKKLNEELKKRLGIDYDALVKDEELGIFRVSDVLSEDQKNRLTAIIFDRLAAEVRMAVDEGKDLRERQYEPLLRVYNTLTAIVGLDTAQKSEIKQKLNFEVISFMLFNSFQNEESNKMIAEMASHIGAEANIFTGMLRRKETFSIKGKDGKEMEVGEFNIYDWARIMGSKIVDPDDRAIFGITEPVDKVGRTYGTMMYASNKPEIKLLGKGVVTRQVILDQYGQEHYDKLIQKFAGKDFENEQQRIEAEKGFLESIGKKYFDYPNGVYVYWRMTNQMADYVGNAYIDNTKLVPPAGIPESLWKNDMKLLYLFHENYHGVKNIDMLLWLRTAFNSMMVKEASEIWSWLINVDENPTSQVESIYTGLFGGEKKKNDSRTSIATLVQQAFLKSMFEDETITLSKHNHHLHKRTKILEGIPAKSKDGLLVVDTMTRRRDWGTFREKMYREATGWSDSVFEQMDFGFIANKMKHIPKIRETLLEGASNKSLNRQKFFYLIDNMSDEFALFDNLAQKRGDTPMKYNLDNFGVASKAALALAQDITYANGIAFIAEAQKVSGVGKIGELAISVIERIREKRESMELWQKYVIPMIKDGRVVVDPDSYVGDLPGAYPLFKLEERTVTLNDISMHPEGVSIASLGGDVKGVDKEEIQFKYALDRLWELNIVTEEEYKHFVKDFYKEMKGWNNKKNPLSELWAHVSGKKLIEYWAARLNVPGEVLEKWIFEGGAEFFGLWWKYFNGTGAAHH